MTSEMPGPAKNKRKSLRSFLLDEVVTKRSKHVDTPPPEDVVLTDIPDQPVPHVAATHPPVVHPGPVHVPAVVAPPPPPPQPTAPTTPREIAGNGRAPGALNNHAFNALNDYHYPPVEDAVATFRANPNASKKLKRRLSEKMGEHGAVAYLRKYTGHGDIELHRATDTDPHLLEAKPGFRWSHVVAFNASGVADLTYWDGAQLHVVEAKGGNSGLGERGQAFFHVDTDGETVMNDAMATGQVGLGAQLNLENQLKIGGTWKDLPAGTKIPQAVKQYHQITLAQGTTPYLTDIGYAMLNSDKTDGRKLIGRAILDNIVTVHYQAVRTQATNTGADVKTF